MRVHRYTTEKMSAQKKSNKNIRAFAAATFLNDLGSDMISSIWPLFVTNVLKANMAALGFLDGIGNSLVSISKAISGYLSDKSGKRKIFIWTGYLIGALGRFGFSLSRVWPHLIPFKILERLAKERSAPRDALVVETSPAEKLGQNFGFLRAMDHLGGICGILISILLIRYIGFRSIIMLGALPTLVSAILVITLIHEPEKNERINISTVPAGEIQRKFKFFLLLSSIYSLGAFSYSFLLLFAGNHGFAPPTIPILYLIITAAASMASLTFGRISDKVGRKPVLGLAYVLWMAACAGYLLDQSRVIIIAGMILYGGHIGIINPILRTIVSEMAPEDHRGSYIGMFQMVTGLCALPASFIAGLLWETMGMNTPFFFGFGMTLISGIFLIFWKKPADPAKQQNI